MTTFPGSSHIHFLFVPTFHFVVYKCFRNTGVIPYINNFHARSSIASSDRRITCSSVCRSRGVVTGNHYLRVSQWRGIAKAGLSNAMTPRSTQSLDFNMGPPPYHSIIDLARDNDPRDARLQKFHLIQSQPCSCLHAIHDGTESSSL